MGSLYGTRVRNLLLAVCISLGIAPALAQTTDRAVQIIRESRHDLSLPLAEMARSVSSDDSDSLGRTLDPRPPFHFIVTDSGPDTVAQEVFGLPIAATNLLNFDGTTQSKGGGTPPDTNGSVGTAQFVQLVNFAHAVYDKSSGALILGPKKIVTIWSGFGGLCSTKNGGDPVVLWDKAAKRWLVTQLSYTSTFSSNYLCIAVSTSSDATGSYNRYAFSMGNTVPDYPKYAIWPDAYYLSFNAFGSDGSSFSGAEPCALDRIAMLAGKTAAMICFTPNPANASFLPADMDGTMPPPSGAPNHYLELGNTTHQLDEFDFHVDFTNPAISTFTGPNAIPVAPFSLICHAALNRACVPQPSPGEKLDSVGDRLMFRLAYRNFGDYESMVVAHTVKPATGSSATAATRWYELRSTPPGGTFFVYQSGTLQDTTASLWMASIAEDKLGDVAIGMSVSSSTLDPSVVYTGRVPTDPLGTMGALSTVVQGTGVQLHTVRWGDYSSMSVDPTDDCTFWYSQEYYKSTGNSWNTRVVAFKFDACN
jgi:hypothetical protein